MEDRSECIQSVLTCGTSSRIYRLCDHICPSDCLWGPYCILSTLIYTKKHPQNNLSYQTSFVITHYFLYNQAPNRTYLLILLTRWPFTKHDLPLPPDLICVCRQWWKVTKYVYTKVQCWGTCALLDYFHVLLPYTFIPPHFGANILFSTPQHLSHNFSY